MLAAALNEACIHTYTIKPSLEGSASVVKGPSLPKVTQHLSKCLDHCACIELLPTLAVLCCAEDELLHEASPDATTGV